MPKASFDASQLPRLIWACALLLAGVGVLFRIEQVMPRLMQQYPHFASVQWFIRFCFYLMAALLIGGGGRKLAAIFRNPAGRGDTRDDTGPSASGTTER